MIVRPIRWPGTGIHTAASLQTVNEGSAEGRRRRARAGCPETRRHFALELRPRPAGLEVECRHIGGTGGRRDGDARASRHQRRRRSIHGRSWPKLAACGYSRATMMIQNLGDLDLLVTGKRIHARLCPDYERKAITLIFADIDGFPTVKTGKLLRAKVERGALSCRSPWCLSLVEGLEQGDDRNLARLPERSGHHAGRRTRTKSGLVLAAAVDRRARRSPPLRALCRRVGASERLLRGGGRRRGADRYDE
jgi:hypothetical protein